MTTSIPEEQTNHRAGNGDKEGTGCETPRPLTADQSMRGPLSRFSKAAQSFGESIERFE